MKIVLLESLGISESSLQRHIAPLTEAGHEFKAYPKNTDSAVQIEEARCRHYYDSQHAVKSRSYQQLFKTQIY